LTVSDIDLIVKRDRIEREQRQRTILLKEAKYFEIVWHQDLNMPQVSRPARDSTAIILSFTIIKDAFIIPPLFRGSVAKV
jgi:predicted nucleotidyltransferase